MRPTTFNTESKITGKRAVRITYGREQIQSLQRELSTHGLNATRQLYILHLRDLITRYIGHNVRRTRQRGYNRMSQVIEATHQTRQIDMVTLQAILRAYCEIARDCVSNQLPLYGASYGSQITLTFTLPTTLEDDNAHAPQNGTRQIYPQVNYNLRFVHGVEIQGLQNRYLLENKTFSTWRVYVRNFPSTEDGTQFNFNNVVPFRQ